MTTTKRTQRIRRHGRVRARISGTAQRPRVAVFKSNRHLYVQVIDDVTRKTLIGLGDVGKTSSAKKPAAKIVPAESKVKSAFDIGQTIGSKLKASGITQVIFDRGGFKYHGRIKAVADGLRSGGVQV